MRPIELAESQLIVGNCQCGGFYREHADQEPVAHRPDWVQGQCEACSDLTDPRLEALIEARLDRAYPARKRVA